MTTVISVENLSKTYRLGQIGTGTFTTDLKVWWAKRRGRPNPLLKIGQRELDNDEAEELWALNNLSFTVNQGQVLGIIGRNGAGKSTLLKVLSRVTAPTSGKIKVKGRIASLLEVGTGFHPELTGRENIYLNGAILGMKHDEITHKFDEIVNFSEVEKFIDTPVKRYSSGMYVRLAFAVAAHLDPEILVVDEVLAVGDAEFQKKCLGKMGDVANDGRTVLFVSHNMHAIASLTSHSILLSNGSIKFQGNSSEAISKYLLEQANPDLIFTNIPSKEDVRITYVELLTTLPNNTQVSGKLFEIKIIVDTPVKIENVRLSIQVMNSTNESLAYFWNFNNDITMDLEPGEHFFTCKVPAFRLYKGNYTLTIHLSDGNGQRKLQLLENICPFTVELFGKQHPGNWHSGICVYLEDFQWEHNYLTP
ncbi:MAG: ABC transporter ATP-binding protein [Anaerolineales bacterium]|nr:ABC transporter ATP-binding protein [Anaerolineales bacterium]